LITAPYISRILGPDRIGIYSYTQSLVTYFVLFAGLGTATYGVRKIALFRDDKKNYSKNFWEIEIINVATSLISIF
ncbi:oligosaccharide flippase family protein, partial [Acinetobacter baumannii]